MHDFAVDGMRHLDFSQNRSAEQNSKVHGQCDILAICESKVRRDDMHFLRQESGRLQKSHDFSGLSLAALDRLQLDAIFIHQLDGAPHDAFDRDGRLLIQCDAERQPGVVFEAQNVDGMLRQEIIIESQHLLGVSQMKGRRRVARFQKTRHVRCQRDMVIDDQPPRPLWHT